MAERISMDDHDLLIRIDATTQAMKEDLGEVKASVAQKADDERVTRLEERMDKSDEKNVERDKKFQRIVGGGLVVGALLKFVPMDALLKFVLR